MRQTTWSISGPPFPLPAGGGEGASLRRSGRRLSQRIRLCRPASMGQLLCPLRHRLRSLPGQENGARREDEVLKSLPRHARLAPRQRAPHETGTPCTHSFPLSPPLPPLSAKRVVLLLHLHLTSLNVDVPLTTFQCRLYLPFAITTHSVPLLLSRPSHHTPITNCMDPPALPISRWRHLPRLKFPLSDADPSHPNAASSLNSLPRHR